MKHAKPHNLKVIDGTVRLDRLNPNEPKPIVRSPAIPKHLTLYAQQYWKKITPLLLDMGILTEQDGAALENLCETYAELRYTRDEMRDLKPRRSYDEESRFIAEREMVGMTLRLYRGIADADRRLKTWLNEFGLTPAARHRVSSSIVKKEDNPFDEFD